ncbi:MAG: AAA family ATPase [bacterium]
MMDLLERDDDLALLDAAAGRAADGVGSVVVVSGEAGIGKTALIARAFPDAPGGVRVLWGMCDPLFTPRPLGPLHDMAQKAGGALLAAATSVASRETLFAALLDELRLPPAPVVVVVEDAHWADEATLDLLRFLGRRIHQLPAVLVVSYRDDEVGSTHPLRAAIGDLTPRNVRRVRLMPLSSQAVESLARAAGKSPAGWHELTSGNPFFLTEALAADRETIPATVRDAVMARAARLSDAGRMVMELAAVVPSRIDRSLVAQLLAPRSSTIDECRAIGMVQHDDGSLAFRHELARRAIEDALPADRRRALHASCLAALLTRDASEVSVARLVHHADHAGDNAAVLRLGPIAAEQAASVGAHREAAALYGRVLRIADALPKRDRAVLYERYSYECYLTNAIDAACSARAEALALWRELGDRVREGDTLRWMSRVWWSTGNRDAGERFGAEAVEVLEQLPPGRELAMAYSNRAQLALLADDTDAAVFWGTRAIGMAEPLGDTECLCHALNNVGTAEFEDMRPGGQEKVERSLAIALANGYHEHVARAYTNLAVVFERRCLFDSANAYLRDGLAYCEERDLDPWMLYMLAMRALLRFEMGHWNEAVEDALAVLGHPRCLAVSRIPASLVLARIRMHRRDHDWEPLLDDARDLASATKESQRIVPVACARAEAAWLLGDGHRAGDEAAIGWGVTTSGAVRRDVTELTLWLWRAGRLPSGPLTLSIAAERQIAGDWRAAAEEWARIGCTYQRALALADADDESALRDALTAFEQLGSETGAAFVRRRLRVIGARGVPRGDRPSTRRNPARLTTRQLEILTLVCEGLRDAEIAERLFLSTKTVGHHVSAILGKLGVRSRGEATATARANGICPAESGAPPHDADAYRDSRAAAREQRTR